MTTNVGLADISSGLVSWYPFQGNANDYSGNGNNGTIFGSVTPTVGHSGNTAGAMQFDGQTGYVIMGDLPDMNSATFALWLRVDQIPAPDFQDAMCPFFEGDCTGGFDYAVFLISGGKSFFATKDQQSAYLFFPDTAWQVGAWVHLAGTSDAVNGIKQLWVNGKPICATPFSGNANQGYHFNLSVGAMQDSCAFRGRYFQGAMEDLRFYNRALSPDEIQQLYLPAYDFTGFLPPIGGADATGGAFDAPLRTFKLKSTIPVKFYISSSGSAITNGEQILQLVKWSDQTTSDPAIDATPSDSATSGDQFRLVDGNVWQFNLDTAATGMSTGIWQVIAKLSDGTQHAAWIQLK